MAGWDGWVWPVAITDGRHPVVSQGYKPPDHLGVDIMFPKRAGDPVGPVRHDASKMFVAPRGSLILASGPGRVWSSGEGQYGKYVLIDHGMVGGRGVTTFYQHLDSFAQHWQKGDVVYAGQVLGVMGYSPALDSEQLRHLHFELRFPGSTDLSSEAIRWTVNPVPYMALWRMTIAPSNIGPYLLLGAAALTLLYLTR